MVGDSAQITGATERERSSVRRIDNLINGMVTSQWAVFNGVLYRGLEG